MVKQKNNAIESGLNFDKVDWDRYIKRWLLYAHRYIPSQVCVDALCAEDVVFQAIDAVLSGRRTYTRPNIFTSSNEPDHQGPFFVYVCSVIRAICRSSRQRDHRYTALDHISLDHTSPDHTSVDNVDDSAEFGMYAGNSTELFRNSCELTDALEQEQQLRLFKKYLRRNDGDLTLLKIADSLQCANYGELSAEQKAAELQIDIRAYNNALKRFKRILKKFVAHQQQEESNSSAETRRR